MKLTLSLALPLLSAVLFFSCKSDEIVSSPGGSNTSEYFNWSFQAPTLQSILVQTIDRNSYYASSFDSLYKVTGTTAVLFTEHNSEFAANRGYVYDNTYIVYSGKRVSNNKAAFMIYDNGSYTIYDQPQGGGFLTEPFFETRGKFYCSLYDSVKYYKFQNGTFTSYPYSGSFGKANGNIYLFTRISGSTQSVYKVTDSGPVFIRTYGDDGVLYMLNNDVIRIAGNPRVLSYFTEAAWTSFFTLPIAAPYPSVMKGADRNKFITIGSNDSTNFGTYVWDGTNYTKQTNFPAEALALDFIFYSDSKFIDNTFYLALQAKFGNTYIVKGTMK